MKVTKKMLAKWAPVTEKGDQSKIARKLKKHPSTISRIMTGKEDTTLNIIAKIDQFYEGKKAVLVSVTETN